jgi:RHS repeat-associated protein
MVAIGRTYSNPITSNYRYGFNGKEHEDETVGGDYDYGMRIYDSRIAKFLSVDPVGKKYPSLSPFQFANNCPIAGIDLDGLEFVNINSEDFEKSLARLKNDHSSINQGSAGTCGAASICYLWMEQDWASFEKAVRDLYTTGQATTPGGSVLKPNADLQANGPESGNFPSYNKHTVHDQASERKKFVADWIIISSVMDQSNWFQSYDGNNSGDGTSNYSTRESMEKMLGLNCTFYHSYAQKNSGSIYSFLRSIEAYHKSGYAVEMDIDARLVGNTTEGGHSVAYAGGLTITSRSTESGVDIYEITFKVVTWGKEKTVTLTSQNNLSQYIKGANVGHKPKK